MPGKFVLAVIVVASVAICDCAPPNILSQILADLKQGYQGQLSNLHAEFNKRQAGLEERYTDLEKKYNSLNEILHDKKRRARGITSTPEVSIPNISFYAQLSNDVSNIGDFQTIVFDIVTTNNGNGYNNVDGIFTASTSGTFVFSWTAANVDHTHMQTELVVKGKVFGTTWSDAYDHADVAVGSNTVVVNLEEGDTVWIRSNTVHSRQITGRMLSTFSGWMLR